MSLFSFFNKKSEEVSAVFHIGSGSVDAHLVKLSKISKPEIIYATKAPISFQKNIDLERYFKLMVKAFDSTLQDIQKRGLLHLNFTGLRNHRISNAFYVLCSPWCVSQTKIIKIKKDKPFEITVDLIEGVIIDTKLNGYRTAEIFGKKAKDAELAFFMTSAPEYVLKELNYVARKYFNFHISDFHSFALSAFSAIREVYSDKENFIFIDTHGELTDLSIIKDNIFAESVSFPVGENFFVRQASKDLLLSGDESCSLINLHINDKCDSATSQKVQATMDKSLKVWLEKFHSVLTSLSLNMYVPRTIFIMADDEFSLFLANKLKEEKFSQFSMTEESFNVIVLNDKSLCGYCVSDKKIAKEPFAELECVFLNKIFNTK